MRAVMNLRSSIHGRMAGRFLMFGVLLGALPGAGLEFAFVPAAATAAAPLEEARLAMEAYGEGDHAEAVLRFTGALEAAGPDAILHYNLGNAHWRGGSRAEAIASWKRALDLSPRLAAAERNLEFVAAQSSDVTLLPVLSPWDRMLSPANRSLLPGIAAILLLIASLLAILRQWGRTIPLVWPGSFAVLSLVSLGFWATGGALVADRGWAVVAEESVELRSGPGSGYHVVFALHEGFILEPRREDPSGWVQVDLGGERVGWLPQASLLLP